MPRLLETVVHLTRDGIWPWIIPAEGGEPWPDGATAHTRFMNSAGAQVADINAVEVTPEAIRFLAIPADVNDIPAGAKFETFVETPQGPLKIRYGTVIRPEAKFFDSPARAAQSTARLFTDSLQRTALGARWEPVAGGTKLYNNSAQSLATGMGPNVGLFSNSPSAVRWHEQTLGDTIKVTFTIVMPTVFGATNGKTTAVLCADQMFTTGLAVQVDSVNNQLHLAMVNSPTVLTYLGTAITNVPASNDAYTALYNHLTKTLAVYKGTSQTPLGTPWVDVDEVVPHGNGYRHTGFMFKPTSLETGPQVSGWAAKDEV